MGIGRKIWHGNEKHTDIHLHSHTISSQTQYGIIILLIIIYIKNY